MARLLLAMMLGLGALACTRPEDRVPPPVSAAPAGDTAQGRLLFHRGEAERGAALRAFIGPERVELAGRAAACANCHHFSGTGRKEGGVAAPDITARSLFRERPGPGEGARPAYDQRTLADALTRGVSPTGRMLSIAMPRFQLPPAELAALIAYLRVLGEEHVPGVTPQALRLGAALPLTGPLATVGEDVRAVLQAVLADINTRGGLYGRKLELVVEDTAQAPRTGRLAGRDAVARLLDAGVLALVGSQYQGQLPSEARAAREGVPVVAPLGFPDGQEDADAPVFFLYPGVGLQARAVVQHLAGTAPAAGWAIVHARDRRGERWAEAARAEAAQRGWSSPHVVPYTPGKLEARGVAAELSTRKAAAVLFCGAREELVALVSALEATGGRTEVFAPSLAGGEMAAAAPMEGLGRVTFTSPTLAGAALVSRGRDFAGFLARHHLRPRHVGFQMSAYAAARILEEALKQAGVTVSREGLVEALASVRKFDTGVTPPVTFGLNRRVGIQGAALVRWAPTGRELVPVVPWVEVVP